MNRAGRRLRCNDPGWSLWDRCHFLQRDFSPFGKVFKDNNRAMKALEAHISPAEGENIICRKPLPSDLGLGLLEIKMELFIPGRIKFLEHERVEREKPTRDIAGDRDYTLSP